MIWLLLLFYLFPFSVLVSGGGHGDLIVEILKLQYGWSPALQVTLVSCDQNERKKSLHFITCYKIREQQQFLVFWFLDPVTRVCFICT